MSEKLKKLFTNRDLDRYKTHEKGYYPPESTYKPKSKITKYKKKIYNTIGAKVSIYTNESRN